MTRGAAEDREGSPDQPGGPGPAEERAYLEAQARLEAWVRAYLTLCDYRPPPPGCASDWGFDIDRD
jgi:hypothetical protein